MGLPTSDFYAGLPELAEKPPSERRRLVYQAAVKRGDAIWVVPLSVALVTTGAFAAAGWWMIRLGAKAAGATNIHDGFKTLLVGLSILVFTGAWVIARRVLVVRSLRRLLNRAACPFCEFSLVGLKPRGAIVLCPECGQRFSLYEHGLKPDDLLTEHERRRPFKGAGRYGAYKVPQSVKR